MSQLRLYKNLEKEYFDAFKEHGSLRVGTLNAYREIEDTRKDAKEGLKEVILRPEEDIFFPEMPAHLMPSNIRIIGGFVSFGRGSKVDIGSQIPNAYIFCVSEKRIRNRFGDAYYEIIKPAMFGNMLYEKLKQFDPQVFRVCLEKVSYGGTKDQIIKSNPDLKKLKNYDISNTDLSDYFLKPAAFRHEFERRYVFLTRNPNIEKYVDLTCDLKMIHLCCNFPETPCTGSSRQRLHRRR